MKLVDLKNIIARLFCERQTESETVTKEILENVFGSASCECVPKPVTAFEVDGTLVFLSEAGLPSPKRFFLADVKARTLILQDIAE